MFRKFFLGTRARNDTAHFIKLGVVVGVISSYFSYNLVLQEFPPPNQVNQATQSQQNNQK